MGGSSASDRVAVDSLTLIRDSGTAFTATQPYACSNRLRDYKPYLGQPWLLARSLVFLLFFLQLHQMMYVPNGRF